MTRADHDAGVFESYAGFYDALYADKDYEAEVDFLEAVFSGNGVARGGTVLDLGCGTGGHVIPLARRGYRVTGVDRAAQMIALARAKAEAQGVSAEFLEADVRSADLGRSFDAVISMFAVMSYQLTNDDLASAFRTARRHVAPGGLFVFDAWFGPAVLAEQPEPRTKVVTTPAGETITRAARPLLDPVAQTVEVRYDVTRESAGAVVERTTESHRVRFLFAQELDLLLGQAGFTLVTLAPFMELDRPPTTADWNISVVAIAS